MDKEKFLEKIKEEQEELKASLISIFTPFVYDSELLEYCSIREEEDYIVSSIELRDKGKRLSGRGVKSAVNNVNTKIAPLLLGMDAFCQREIDTKMIFKGPN